MLKGPPGSQEDVLEGLLGRRWGWGGCNWQTCQKCRYPTGQEREVEYELVVEGEDMGKGVWQACQLQ